MIFTSCFKSFTSFIYCMCLIALYIEFSYSWVEQSQGKCSLVLFSSLSCGLAFQLAYSYIQCTDASWPASYDDADTGTPDQHPVCRWSSWALQSQWWASLLSGGLRYFVSFSCVVRMLRGLSQHPSQYVRGFIDSQSVSIESLIYVYM